MPSPMTADMADYLKRMCLLDCHALQGSGTSWRCETCPVARTLGLQGLPGNAGGPPIPAVRSTAAIRPSGRIGTKSPPLPHPLVKIAGRYNFFRILPVEATVVHVLLRLMTFTASTRHGSGQLRILHSRFDGEAGAFRSGSRSPARG